MKVFPAVYVYYMLRQTFLFVVYPSSGVWLRYILIQYVFQFVQQMADIACMYYIEIPQEVTNENAITLVFIILLNKNCYTSCNTTDGPINAHLYNWNTSSYYIYIYIYIYNAMTLILNWLFVLISQQELHYPAVYRFKIHSIWIYRTLKPFCTVAITSDYQLDNSFCSDNSSLTVHVFILLSFLLLRCSISFTNLMLGEQLVLMVFSASFLKAVAIVR